MALRSHVVEAAGVRYSEHPRACYELGPTARSAPASRTQSRVREHGGRRTIYSPRAPVSLTRRLRRAVAVWEAPEEPGGSRLRPLFGDVTFFYTATALPAPRRLARRRLARCRHARRRHALRRLRRAACAYRSLRRAVARGAASQRSASSVSPPRAAL